MSAYFTASAVTRAISGQPSAVKDANRAFIAAEKPHALLLNPQGYAGPTFPGGAPDSGGQITYVNNKAAELVKLGYKVSVITRAFEVDAEMREKFGSREGAAFFGPDNLARYVYVPSIRPDFVLKEQIYAELPAMAANLSAFLAHEAIIAKQEPQGYVDLISSHYCDGGIVGQLLVRKWQEWAGDGARAEELAAMNRHAWTPHSIGMLKQHNMDSLPVDKRKPDFDLDYARLNFPIRQHAEQALVGTDPAIFNGADVLYHNTSPAAALVYTSPEILEHMDKLGAPSHMPRIEFPPGMEAENFYPRESVNQEDVAKLLTWMEYEGGVPADLVKRMRENPQSFNVVVEMSRMDSTKRKEIPIEAMSHLPENTILFLTGKDSKKNADGSKSSPVFASHKALIKKLGLEGRVFLLGRVPDEHMGPLGGLPHGKNADQFRVGLVVGASRMEGWGMAVVDMSAGGLAMVSSSRTPSMVKASADLQAAQIIQVGETDEPRLYAEAMLPLIESPALARKYAELGIAFAANYHWPALVKRFVEQMGTALHI